MTRLIICKRLVSGREGTFVPGPGAKHSHDESAWRWGLGEKKSLKQKMNPVVAVAESVVR